MTTIQTATKEQLGKAYEEVVGYSIFEDDETNTVEEVREMMVEYDQETEVRYFENYFLSLK